MRIAMIGPFGFHPNKTMRSRALQLAKCLVQRDHVVKIFMPPWHTPDEGGKDWEEDGVAIRYTVTTGGTVGITAALINDVFRWKPDIAHAFKPKAYSGLASWWLWSRRRTSITLVTDTDDWEGAGGWNEIGDYTALQKRFFNWQEGWGLKHHHALTFASRELGNRILAMGVPEEKIFYLPNGPGISVLPPRSDTLLDHLGLDGRPTVLLYSRLFEFDTARVVAILGKVKAQLPNLAVLVIGMSLFEKDAASFRKAISEAGLEDSMVEAGWVDEDVLPDYLRAADVGIYLMDDNPINRSKCPVKLADMLSVGLPVVAEAVGQVPEYVVQGETGLLRDSGDVVGLAQDLVSILRNEELRQKLGQGAEKHVAKNFSWERLASVAEEAYLFASTRSG